VTITARLARGDAETEHLLAENRAAAIIAFAKKANPSLPDVPLPKPTNDRHLRPVQ
jgi:hypothetical protein